MMPKKLRLELESGKIVSTKESDITKIIIDGCEYKFPEGYIIPSLVDSHAHIIGLGTKLNSVNIEHTSSKDELLSLVKKIDVQDDWICGRGWNEELWECKELNRFDLDAVNNDVPIFLVRVDGHAAWVNSKALELCSIDSNSKDPEGGKIIKDEHGNPTGILIDNAIELVRNRIPLPSKELVKKYILDACNECLRVGISEVHDMDVHLEDIAAYKELDEQNELPIRLIQYIRGFDGDYETLHPTPYIGNNLKIIGLKFYADGALGSRGALMIDKYVDADTNGLELISKDELQKRVEKGCKAGWEIAVHAIGDKANRNVLDVFERIRKSGYTNRLRIEHSQLISPADVQRFAELDVIASVQPIHCTSDKKMAIERLGKDYKHFYPWRTLSKANAILIGGSDFPIESHNPFLGIDAFVNRVGNGEIDTWDSHETLSIEDALKTYCSTPHQILCSIYHYDWLEVNAKADFLVIDNDLSDKSKIKNTKVIATICNGKITKYL